MATEVKRRRGTTAQHLDFIGAEAEITVDIEKYTLLVHDDSGTKPTGHELLRADFSNIPSSITADVTIVGEVEASEFIGDLRGAVRFQVQADVAIAKGDAVYISGVSGNKPTVGLADADDATKMPAFGLAAGAINANATGEVITFGTLSGIDTDSFTVGDVLYISTNGTSGNTLTATAPAGESAQIQNIGKVQRSHASAGSIKVGGAGRSNATPNLDQDKIFLGDSNNRSVSTALSSINLSSFNDDVVSGSYLPLTGGIISQNLTISGNLTVSGTTTTVNTETINLADNIITLNSNFTGNNPTENAGIEVERGDLTNKSFFWDETNDRWNADSALVASSFIKQSNSGGFLKADGTEDTSTYLTTVTEAAVLAHADNYANWTVTVGATNQNIGSGDALTLTAGTGISLSITGANVTIDSTISDGDITAVNTQSNSGLSGGSTSGNIDLSLDISNLTAITTADSQDPIAILDGSTTKKITLGNIPISAFNDDSTFLKDADFTSNGFLKRTGDGTYAVDTNTYLTSETSHSDVVVDGDFTTAGFMKTDGSGTYSVDGSTFDNYNHWTISDGTNSGDIDAGATLTVAAGTGITTTYSSSTQTLTIASTLAGGDITAVNTAIGSGLSGGASTGEANLQISVLNLTDMTDDVVGGDDELIIRDASVVGNQTRRKAINEIKLSQFNNDAGFGAGDITGVTAGAGLSGGGTSGAVTLSHSDTSSQASVDNSNGSVIQDVTLDTYGHVTGLTSVDLDSRYLELSGGTLTGGLNIENGNPLRFYSASGAYANADARNSGNGARIHRFNKNSTNTGYLPYYENWYDGNSYHSIGVENDVWQISDGLDVSGRTKVYSAIGASDNVRTGLAHYDTTAMAVNVGGQVVLGYKYDTGGTYTEGAILKTYKENGTSGQYGSGLKFQVRNHGANLSTKMILDPSGNVGINNSGPSSSYKLDVNGAGHFVNDLILDEDLVVADNIYLSDTNTALLEGGGNSVRIQTDTGFIELGPKNSSYSHIETDRPQFYFNKQLVVDTGIVESYNEDLQLRRAASSTDKLTIKDNEFEFNLAGSTQAKIEPNGKFTLITSTTTKPSINSGASGTEILNINSSHTYINDNADVDGNLGVTGNITSGSFVKDGGTSSQFLKADGSVDSSTYLTAISSEILTQTEGDARYLRSNADDTTTGNITIGKADPVLILNDTSASNSTVLTAFTSYRAQGSEKGFVGYGSGSNNYLYVRNSDGRIDIQGSTGIYLNSDTTLSGDLDVTGAIVLEDSQPIKWDTNNILSHNGTSTYLGDAASASTLTLSGGNGTFEGDLSITGGDLTLGTDSIASNINAVGDVLAFKVDSNENSGGTPNMQFKVGAATELTINGSTATFAGDVNMASAKIESDGSAAAGAYLELHHNNNNTTDVCATINLTNNEGGYASIVGGTTGANNTGYIEFKTDNAGTQGTVLTLNGDNSATFAGSITTNLSSEGTYFTGGSGGLRQLSITSGTNTSAHALHTFNIASSNGKYEFDVNGTTELSLDSSSATFAGDVIAPLFETIGTGYLYLGGHVRLNNPGSGAFKLGQYNGSSWTDTLDITNAGDATFAGNLDVDGTDIVISNSLILGEDAYNASTNYVGMKTSFQTGTNDYMIISGKSDGNTYLSARDGSSLHLRGGGNDSGNEIIVYDSGVVDRIDIDTSTAYFNGNVGIGVTSTSGLKTLIKGATGYPATSGTTQTGVLRISGGTGLYNVLDMGVNETTDVAWMQATRANTLAVYDKLAINPYGGNVGIGTTSPNYKLEVNGNAEFLDNVNIKSNSYDDYQIAVDSVGFSIYNRTDAAYNMTIDHTGNVGIGTDSPVNNTPLTLQAPSGYTDTLWLKSVGTNIASRINIGPTGTGNAQINNATGTNIEFQVSGSEKMRITSGGDVEIGTITNAATRILTIDSSTVSKINLDVGSEGTVGNFEARSGEVSIGANTAADLHLKTSGTDQVTVDYVGNVGIGDAPTMKLNLHHSDQDGLRFTTANNAETFIDFADPEDNDAGSIRYDHADNSLSLRVNTSTRMRIDSSGTIIGTGTYTAGNSIKIFEAQRSGGAVASDWSYDDATTDMSLGTSTAHSFSFKTGGTRALTIDTSGQVYFKSSTDFKIGLNDSSNVNQWWLKSYTNGDFAFHENGVGDQFTIQAGGNVGIGTTSPSSMLNVNTTGTSNFGLKLSRGDSATDGFEFTYTPSNAVAFIENKYPATSGQVYGDIVFRHNVGGSQTERMRLEADGGNVIIQEKVGIGTDDPKELLHIYQQGTVSNYYDEGALQIGGPSTSYGALLSYHGSSSGRVSLSSLYNTGGANATLSFGFGGINTNGRPTNEVLTVNQAGNVGIGTDSPTLGKLVVKDNYIVQTDGTRNVYFGSDGTGGLIGTTTNHYTRFITNNTERMRILSSGGITFNGDTAAANALDDYEEGSWTPVYASSSATVTSSSYDPVTFGRYIKVGNVVHLWARMRTDTLVWSSSSGSVYISGVPFTVTDVISGPIQYAGSIGYANAWGGEEPQKMSLNGSELIFLYYNSTTTSNSSNIQPSDTGSGANSNDIVFQLTYRTD